MTMAVELKNYYNIVSCYQCCAVCTVIYDPARLVNRQHQSVKWVCVCDFEFIFLTLSSLVFFYIL